MGPNPNSRYARMPDDPKGEGLKAIKNALERIDRASPLEAELIKAMYVLYDKDAIADQDERDHGAHLAAMRRLNQQYPDDSDIAALYAASYMSIGRWDYWDSEGNPKSETLPVAQALEHIMAKDMTNPVLHLHIHLIEASFKPERALASADALEATVPIAGHVVHMPAHIYVRVGQYAKAVDSNVRSQAVDIEFAKLWGDYPCRISAPTHCPIRFTQDMHWTLCVMQPPSKATMPPLSTPLGAWLTAFKTPRLWSVAAKNASLRPG